MGQNVEESLSMGDATSCLYVADGNDPVGRKKAVMQSE